MSSRTDVAFLLASVLGIILIMGLVTILPLADQSTTEAAADSSRQPVRTHQQTDPLLVVPESTMGEKPQPYAHNWEDNPVATIPESTMGTQSQRYPHNWDDNPMATIPESTMNE